MRLTFRGTTATFERWLSPDAPLELGRNTPELDARGNTRVSRCQLKLRLSSGKVLLESCGANPTGIRRSGLTLWEWLIKGETRPLGMGDSVALGCTGKGADRTPDTVLTCSAAVVTTAAPAPDEPTAAASVPVLTASAARGGHRAHMKLKVAGQDGIEVYFKLKQTTPLKKLMDAFCNHQGIGTNSVRFLYDGNTIHGAQTPAMLGMEDGDVIDSLVEVDGLGMDPDPSTELRQSRAPMDPLAALLSERPPQQLSVAELRARIALLEDAARAYRAELESRTTLHALPDEMQQLVFGKLCNALDPRCAVAYSSASKGLRELMQRVGEGAGKSPLEQLQEENAAAAALCLKVGVRSCKALREAKQIFWRDRDLSASDLATLGKLIPVLPALERLVLDEESDSAGPDGGQRLVEGLGVGALPALTNFALDNVPVGDAGASALAAALERGALPRLEQLYLRDAAIGDAGMLALAPALRRRPALDILSLDDNLFGDEGLAALLAQPPADAPPPQAEALAQLKGLDLASTQITDDGCAHLASRLRSGALPALESLLLYGIPASIAAIEAVYEARACLQGQV